MAIHLPGLPEGSYFSLGSAIVTAVPLTMFCWARPATDGANRVLMVLQRVGGFADFEYFSMETAPSGFITANQVGPGFTIGGSSKGTFTADTWCAFGSVFVNNSSRFSWLNGVVGAESTTAVNSPSVGDTFIGARVPSTTFREYEGCIAHAAIWNIALTDQNMQDLGNGVKIPSDISGGLVFYCKFVDQATATVNEVGSALTLHETVTTCASSPPIVVGTSLSSYSRIIGF